MNNDDSVDQTNQMDTAESRVLVEDRDENKMVLTIDQSNHIKEDENNNDQMDSFTNLSAWSSDQPLNISELSNDNSQQIDPNTNSLKSAEITAHDRQTTSDDQNEEQTITSNEQTTDNIIAFKSENNQIQSSDDSQKKENETKTNKKQCHLWVSNIAKETHASHLKELFSKYGKVLSTKVIGSSSAQWFGYINLASPDDVEKCINALHQTELHGKKIYVDREMHEERSSSKTKTSNSSTLSSSNNKSRSSDNSTQKSSMGENSASDPKEKTSSNKRSASTTNETKKKLSTSDLQKSKRTDESIRRSSESITEKRPSLSSSGQNQSSRGRIPHSDRSRSTERSASRSSQISRSNDRQNESNSSSFGSSSKYSSDSSKFKNSSSQSSSSHSNERHSTSTSKYPNRRRSLSDEKSKVPSSFHGSTSRYDKMKEPLSKDHRRSIPSNNFHRDRRSRIQQEQRSRHEKEIFDRKQFVRQQEEEERLKEQQRRLAEEQEHVQREFALLEQQRAEIERNRLELEKEKQKQEQAREAEKQRQQQLEAKIRDEKLHRLANEDNKRSRSSSHYDSQRSHHPNKNNNSSLTKSYDRRSPSNNISGHGRNRSPDHSDRSYYPDAKRPYTNNSNNQREVIFRDRVGYRDSDPSTNSTNSNQRYVSSSSSSSNQNRLSDPYGNLPPRARDTALPPSSAVSAAYERPNRTLGSSPTNSTSMSRRPQSRETFDNRDYHQESDRRDRSPTGNNRLHRESMDSSHWARPKPRDSAHYSSESSTYLPNQYLPESSSHSQQSQQGLWSSAPPSRQTHLHSDVSGKPSSHVSTIDSYGWQHLPQQASSSHDRSRSNIGNNPRIPMIPSNQQPSPSSVSSSRGNTTGQSHLYNHPGLTVAGLSSTQQAQQHVPLVGPPPPAAPLQHTTAFVSPQVPPTGLVLHTAAQARNYDPHYVVTQPVPLQRRY